ncbi:hypothetical protein NC653_024809 [Populus alba x Populus x berolinensis]|uniref:Uncharacterized protein n=1 Tax=Populus alba x Populus x berolinensis TaxID=444605 RepID=A0AAD6MAP7_9ROSI|nr:hypothetical protein NC653_024809 [Populus alba x Populus x berolinensis]
MRGNFSKEEDDTIIKLHGLLGNRNASLGLMSNAIMVTFQILIMKLNFGTTFSLNLRE